MYRINVFYHILGNVTVNLTYILMLASRPRSRRKCPGVRLRTTLIIRYIVSYIWTGFEISITNQINLTVLMFFYRIMWNATVNLTFTPIVARMPRSIRICPGVWLRTLIIRHIVSYIWTEFEISLTNQINFIVLMGFIVC